mmetsp:Transcript_40305/g.108130  ORF Transcript_40305/g.108130 Transcript_40305/m.108130 type:complete len:170 (+) Transcript_40305:238-747(+)
MTVSLMCSCGLPMSCTVRMRQGMSGRRRQVTGCLIGTKHVKFTLLGDTVNVASRMESTSTPGHIQCAEATASLIRVQDPSIPLVHRGSVEVKGKGKMETHWVGISPPRPECAQPACWTGGSWDNAGGGCGHDEWSGERGEGAGPPLFAVPMTGGDGDRWGAVSAASSVH